MKTTIEEKKEVRRHIYGKNGAASISAVISGIGDLESLKYRGLAQVIELVGGDHIYTDRESLVFYRDLLNKVINGIDDAREKKGTGENAERKGRSIDRDALMEEIKKMENVEDTVKDAIADIIIACGDE